MNWIWITGTFLYLALAQVCAYIVGRVDDDDVGYRTGKSDEREREARTMIVIISLMWPLAMLVLTAYGVGRSFLNAAEAGHQVRQRKEAKRQKAEQEHHEHILSFTSLRREAVRFWTDLLEASADDEKTVDLAVLKIKEILPPSEAAQVIMEAFEEASLRRTTVNDDKIRSLLNDQPWEYRGYGQQIYHSEFTYKDDDTHTNKEGA